MSDSLWPYGCSPPGSSVHGISQERILKWVAISSRGSSWSRDWTQISFIGRWILYHWTTRKSQTYLVLYVSYVSIKLEKNFKLKRNLNSKWYVQTVHRKGNMNGFSVQFSPVTQSCPTLCDPMDCSMPGLPVHHQLPEFTETHVHWVGDAIQPSHPLLSLSPPAFNLSQHQGLFKWVSSSNQIAKVWELQHQSFQWIFRTSFRLDHLDPLEVQETFKSLLQHHSPKASILSFLYSPTLTSIHDYRKNHSLE